MATNKAPVALLAAFTAIVAGGCIVLPLPHKTEAAGPAGPLPQPPRIKAISPTITTRDQVREQLRDIEIVTGLADHFWGRWTFKKWAIVWLVGGPGGAAGGAEDIKHRANLLVDFDRNGVVSTVRRVGDSDLLSELARWARESQEPPPPVQIKVLHLRHVMAQSDDAILSLSAQGIALRCTAGEKHEMSAPLLGVKLGHLESDEKRGLGNIVVILTMPEKTAMGRLITLQLHAADLFRLVEFTEHYSRQGGP